MFYLEEGLAKSLAPLKQPSSSLTPTLVMKDEQPLMGFGMPGGDLQDQGTLQFFLNVVDFGMGFDLLLFPQQLQGYVHWINDFANFSYSFQPSGANPFTRGVFNTGLPWTDKSPYPWSSVMTMSTLGRGPAAVDAVGPAAATAPFTGSVRASVATKMEPARVFMMRGVFSRPV